MSTRRTRIEPRTTTTMSPCKDRLPLASLGWFFLSLAIAMTPSPSRADTPPPPPATGTAMRLPGPAGSLVIVEPNHVTPLIEVVVASRIGAAADPRNLDGLTNLAAEVARRGAAGRSRATIDRELDALGASLNVVTDLDSVELVGTVLEKHLNAFLQIVADIVLRPDFDADEIERTRREVRAGIDEMRNDDRALGERFFARRLYLRHGYGRAIEGTHDSLARMDRAGLRRHHGRVFSGQNLVFAAAGAVAPEAFRDRVTALFGEIPAGERKAERKTPPAAPRGWRIQLVDKPDRKQVQVLFGHLGLPATHPDHLALSVALASFGGSFMNATLMKGLRVERGLVYGAYMSGAPHRDDGPAQAWLSTGVDGLVETLKLALRLYTTFKQERLTRERLAFVRDHLVGAYASAIDSPRRRLGAWVTAEIQGLPPDAVDTYPERVRALTLERIEQAIEKHVHPNDLAITLVATADETMKRLVEAGIDRGAIDVHAYDSY